MIMVSHMSAPAVTGDNTPCDLSPAVVADLLRTELGYDGVVITDEHNMARSRRTTHPARRPCWPSRPAATHPDAGRPRRRPAGPARCAADGTLTEARIDESVLRILTLKAKAGLWIIRCNCRDRAA